MGVDIGADAETENPRLARVVLLDVGQNLRFVRDADGRHAVGEENDDEGAGAVHRPQGERLVQGIVNRRGAVGLEVLDEILRLGAVGRGGVGEFVKQRFHFRGEADNFKTVAVVLLPGRALDRQRVLQLWNRCRLFPFHLQIRLRLSRKLPSQTLLFRRQYVDYTWPSIRLRRCL